MIVSIHQPEHFPYLGFFQKMQESDLFIILDNVKFKKNNFQNRNRFLNKSGNEEWFTIPVEKKANSKLIRDVKLAEDFGWKKKLMKQMKMNFNMSDDDLNHIYMDDLLYTTNLRSITYCAIELGIDTPGQLASELDVSGTKSELLYNICKKVGATTYLSGKGGVDYLDMNVFKDINVEVFEPKVDNYYTALSHIKEMK
tara:strand:+ start:86 stop:679 length:594 start_codon:yes stop_codon:yes gene_type:complete